MRGLSHDKTVQNKVKINKVATKSKPRISANDVDKKRDDENSGSIIDVMDSFMKIFDPDYKDEENFHTEETFAISKEPGEFEPQTKKRKRSDSTTNNEGTYGCQQCDYHCSHPFSISAWS